IFSELENTVKTIFMKRILPNLKTMKRIIPIVALVSVMAACNSKPDPATVQSQQQTTTSLTAEDSLVLSQFRAWKAENELRDAREFLNGEEGESMTSTSSNAARK